MFYIYSHLVSGEKCVFNFFLTITENIDKVSIFSAVYLNLPENYLISFVTHFVIFVIKLYKDNPDNCKRTFICCDFILRLTGEKLVCSDLFL